MIDKNLPASRIRFRFERLEEAASFTHLEQLCEFRQRACASNLPYCGRENSPRMSFSPALPEGYLSQCEYADLYLYGFVNASEAAKNMRVLDDRKYKLIRAERLPIFFPAFEASVNAVEYLLYSHAAIFDSTSLEHFLALTKFPYKRIRASGKEQNFEVRSLVKSAQILDSGKTFRLMLAFSSGANLRPEIAAQCIFGDNCRVEKVRRMEFYWQNSKGNLEAF